MLGITLIIPLLPFILIILVISHFAISNTSFLTLVFTTSSYRHPWIASQRRGSPLTTKQAADVQQRVLRAALQQHIQQLLFLSMLHTCLLVPELLKIRHFLLACGFAMVALEGVKPFEQLQS